MFYTRAWDLTPTKKTQLARVEPIALCDQKIAQALRSPASEGHHSTEKREECAGRFRDSLELKSDILEVDAIVSNAT